MLAAFVWLWSNTQQKQPKGAKNFLVHSVKYFSPKSLAPVTVDSQEAVYHGGRSVEQKLSILEWKEAEQSHNGKEREVDTALQTWPRRPVSSNQALTSSFHWKIFNSLLYG